MINFQLASFLNALSLLNVAQTRARFAEPSEFMDDNLKGLIRANIGAVAQECARLDMPTALHRLSRLEVMLSTANTNAAIHHELDELFNAVEHDAYQEFFCHYPKQSVGHVLGIEKEWAPVFKAFRSAKADIQEGVDCFALQHNAACVFHMMRAAECGLRAIAYERGIKKINKNKKPIEYATWGDVIKVIEDEIAKIRTGGGKPENKEIALQFYTTAAADLRQLLSNYRDKTMHLRGNYDAGQASSVIFRTKSLLTMLATRLNEDSPRKIKWGI